MKRIVFIILTLVMLLSLCACAEETATKKETTTTITEVDYANAQSWAPVIHLTEDYLGGRSEDVLEELNFILKKHGSENAQMACIIAKIIGTFDDPDECLKYIQEAKKLLGC